MAFILIGKLYNFQFNFIFGNYEIVLPSKKLLKKIKMTKIGFCQQY
jgi:hypothetical protein